MSKSTFLLQRDKYSARTTLGKMHNPDGSLFGYVLEDTVRARGVKVKKETAIPCGNYFMTIRKSPKYGEVVVIYTERDGDLFMINKNGVTFTFVLCHGGNDHVDTEGCLLINKSRDTEKMTAWGSLKSEMVEEVKKMEAEGLIVKLLIVNKSQSN